MSKKIKGTLLASWVAIAQGFESVLFNFFVVIVSIGVLSSPAFAAAELGVKELLMFITTPLFFGPRKFISALKALRTKKGMIYFLSGFIGNATGNLFFILGVAQAGSGYGIVLNSLYPLFSFILIKAFMKKGAANWKVILGIFISLISAAAFILLPSLLSHEGREVDPKTIMGMIFGLLAGLFWALDGVIIHIGNRRKEIEVSSKEIIIIRSGATSLSVWMIGMPLMLIFGPTFMSVATILGNWESMLIIAALVFNLYFIRIAMIAAIDNIGPRMTAVIDNNAFAVGALIAIPLQFIPGVIGNKFSEDFMVWWAYLLLIPLIFGSIIVIYFEEPDIAAMQNHAPVSYEKMKKIRKK